MSCEVIGCFVLRDELCGCWKAAVKAQEHLRLQVSPDSGGRAAQDLGSARERPTDVLNAAQGTLPTGRGQG